MAVTYPNQPVPTVAGEVNFAITKGQRTQSAAQRGRVRPVWTGEDLDISANLAPMYLFMEKLSKSVEVTRPDYFHLEHDMLPTMVHAVNGQLATDTVLTLNPGEGARIVQGQVLQVRRTTEEIRVTGFISPDQATVLRGFKGTQANAITVGEEIMIEGQASLDGERSGDGVSAEPLIKTNYTQIFRAAYELSGRDVALGVYGEEEEARIRKQRLQSMLQYMEHTFLFSGGVSTSEAGGSAYATMGLVGALSTNVTIMAGALSELALIDNFIRPWFRRNREGQGFQKNMYCFAGELFVRALDQFGLASIRYRPDDDVVGMQTTGYQSALGDFKVHLHGLLTPTGSGVSAMANGPQGYVFGVNMDHIGKRHYKNRKLKLYNHRELPDVDGVKNEWLSDEGIAIRGEQLHAIMSGITG